MPVSLRRNFLWTLAGTVTFAMCQWATIIVITKVGSTKLAGDWTLALAITGPIFVFAQLKLRQVQATDAKQENRWGEFVALRMLAMVAAVLTTSTVVLVAYRDELRRTHETGPDASADPEAAAHAALARVLFGSNEFLTVD